MFLLSVELMSTTPKHMHLDCPHSQSLSRNWSFDEIRSNGSRSHFSQDTALI